MPAVFVHGVPETHRIWSPVRALLSRNDTVAVDLPGFSVPVPDGFTMDKESYVEWLIGEVEAIGEPVDIVGHDWGALLTIRLASIRPDLVRTWAVGGGAIDPAYVWHDMARMWQTPGVGEQVLQAMTGDALKAALTGAGIQEADAADVAKYIDDTMKAAILPLYRSAVNVGEEWGPDLPKMPKAGLLIWGADDPYMQVKHAEYMAGVTGARLVSLAGTGHWWPLAKPAEVAKLLEAHWASV